MQTQRKTVRTILLAHGVALLAFTHSAPAQAAEAAVPAGRILLEGARTLVGTPAPALRLETIDGDTIDLAALRGDKAVYLKFWATWCGPCRAQMPHFENVYQNAGEDLAVIALNAGFNDTLEDIVDYREELGIHMPIVIDDGMLAGAFNLRITPQHIVIGKDGLIKHIGNRADAELDAALERERSAPDVPAAVVATTLAALPRLDVGDALQMVTLNVGTEAVALGAPTPAGTVMVFMITWCESYIGLAKPEQAQRCREVRKQVELLRQQHPELRWLGVTSGIWTVAADLDAYARKMNVTLSLALDPDSALFRRFGVMTVPTVIVADANGRIVKRVEGYDPALADALSALTL